MSDRTRALASPVAKLAVFGVGLAVALGGGMLVGAAFGPEPSDDTEPAAHDADHKSERTTPPVDDLPDGLAISRNGYTLDLRTPVVPGGASSALVLVIDGPDGQPLRDYDVESEKELHLVIVGRDLTGYAHVHPVRDDDGVWTVTAPPMAPGSYRVFADFVPAGGERLTLGADLSVPGNQPPAEPPEPSTEATVDGYEVSFDGHLIPGSESELTVTVSRAGVPVTDLQPYLGSLGHLVTIRHGDLAYLHVHPLEPAAGPGGPTVRFAVEVPTDGTYRLFFDFAHDEQVRTASIVTTTTDGGHS
jgi:hypothetical protein